MRTENEWWTHWTRLVKNRVSGEEIHILLLSCLMEFSNDTSSRPYSDLCTPRSPWFRLIRRGIGEKTSNDQPTRFSFSLETSYRVVKIHPSSKRVQTNRSWPVYHSKLVLLRPFMLRVSTVLPCFDPYKPLIMSYVSWIVILTVQKTRWGAVDIKSSLDNRYFTTCT